MQCGVKLCTLGGSDNSNGTAKTNGAACPCWTWSKDAAAGPDRGLSMAKDYQIDKNLRGYAPFDPLEYPVHPRPIPLLFQNRYHAIVPSRPPNSTGIWATPSVIKPSVEPSALWH